jgi:hypothetical protein
MVRMSAKQVQDLGLETEETEIVAPPESARWSTAEVTERPALVYDPETNEYVSRIVRFASGAESRRYAHLELMLKAQTIRKLVPHMHFKLEILTGVNPGPIGRGYTSDSVYEEMDPASGQWVTIVEDVKGRESRDWPLRKELMWRLYGVKIRVIDSHDYPSERSQPRGQRGKRGKR